MLTKAYVLQPEPQRDALYPRSMPGAVVPFHQGQEMLHQAVRSLSLALSLPWGRSQPALNNSAGAERIRGCCSSCHSLHSPEDVYKKQKDPDQEV